LFVAAYNNAGFDPTNPSLNWVADAGSSGTSGEFSFNVIAGQQYTIVVHEVTAPAGIGDNYTLTVQGPGAGICQSFTPTAGEVSVEGRVLVRGGRALENITVTLTSPDGIERTAVTNSFGVYRFTDVPAGDAYVIVPVSTRYRFTPLVLNISEDLTGVDFIAETAIKK
jgi:hypothetical protein